MLTPNGALTTSNGNFRFIVRLLSADNKASSDRAELYFSMSRRLPPLPPLHRKVPPLCIVSIKYILARSSAKCSEPSPSPTLASAGRRDIIHRGRWHAASSPCQPASAASSATRAFHRPRWTGEESAATAHYSRAISDESRASPPTLYRRRANTLSTLRSGSAGQAPPGARRAASGYSRRPSWVL